MNFQGFINDIKQNNLQVYGVEVYKDGELIHSYGDTTENRYPIYSITKAFTSIAVGLAVDEGKMDIEKCILEYLPAWAVEKMSAEQEAVYQHITVKRLLTMSVKGYPFRLETDCWLTEALSFPLERVEEKAFDYTNVSAYLVGVAVSCAVGEDVYAYLNRKVFQPLGIREPKVGRCPDGYFYGASMMELTVHELSKVGLLLANGGVYEGKRILSEAYVKEATSVQQMNREGGYGYFFWKYRDGFSLNGKWGQKCYVLPSQGLIISFLAHIEEGSNGVRASMEKYILKPQYLYHGSQYRFDVLKPQQAMGECEKESLKAIYAAETMKEVIPFALPIRWYPDSPEGKRSFTCDSGKTNLVYGSLNPHGVGYVYKLDSAPFEKVDEWEWVCQEDCVPLEVIEIKVEDYLHTVEFSEEAKKINRQLYG